MLFPTAFAQTPEEPLSLFQVLKSIDVQITVALTGTLAGLALASAGFLLSTRSQMERTFDEKQDKIDQIADSASSNLENQVSELKIRMQIVQSGIKYLVRSFFLFIANMVSLLLLFDSTIQNSFFESYDIIQTLAETIPFLVGILFFMLGANSIRKVFAKKITHD